MNELLAIGILIVIGVIGAKLINKLRLPSVVGWLIVGAILGQSGLKLFTPDFLERVGFISDITLGLIGFIIGAEITVATLRRLGGGIISVILAESFGAFILVFIGVWLLTHDVALALLFGALAPASAPAGTVAVLQEYKADGPLTKALLIVVGVDDALAIMIYVFAASYAKVLVGNVHLSVAGMIGKPLLEILLAIGIGGTLGWLLGFSTQKIRAPETLLPVSIGVILICVGLSKLLHFSLILANVVLGTVAVNTFPRAAKRISDHLQIFILPFYVCFFALAGAHLNFSLLVKIGLLGTIYIICRSGGLIGGAWLGATIGKQPPTIRKYLGLGILSQAGVAVGLAYLVNREFAPLGPSGVRISSIVLTIIAATTIVFEIIGPICTKIAITKAGELYKK